MVFLVVYYVQVKSSGYQVKFVSSWKLNLIQVKKNNLATLMLLIHH